MRYQVIVGNIGTVLETNRYSEALKTFRQYEGDSKQPHGKAAGETVTLLDDGEIDKEYQGTNE